MIRPFEERDAAAIAEILREQDPYHLYTPARVLHEQTAHPERAHFTWLVAEIDGAPVGCGWAELRWESGGGEVADVWAAVRSDYERRGLGRALADALEAHARAAGAGAAHTFALSGSRGEHFAATRGYEVTRREQAWELDPRKAKLPSVEAAVVPLTYLRDRAQDLFELFWTVESDIPGDFAWNGYSFEEWTRETWDDPTLDDETSVVALVDGRPASISWLVVDDERCLAEVEMTGTAPEFRGRGLARACKAESLRRAAERGIERVVTENDFENQAILHLNESLGFRRSGVSLELAKPL